MFTDSRQALAAIAAGQRFDAILCDLMMPNLTGMELHAQLAKIAPDQVLFCGFRLLRVALLAASVLH